MRRLLAWGRQEPLCPAEAASPPPLSSLHHQSPFSSSILPPAHPSATRLFSDIERQLSAKLAADPLLLRNIQQQQPQSQQTQPSPPTESSTTTSVQCSPTEQTPSVGTLTADSAADTTTVVPNPTTTATVANNATNTLLAAVTAVVAHQQQHQNAATTATTISQLAAGGPPQQQKGIDAFLAALANASSNEEGSGGSSSVSAQQLSPTERRASDQVDNALGVIGGDPQQQFTPAVTGLSGLCAQPAQPPPQSQQLSQQQQSIQQAANNALAANLFVNALAAQRQQQPIVNSTTTGATSMLLANLKMAGQTAGNVAQRSMDNSSLHNNSNMPSGTAAINALQLVQQTTAHLQRQQQQMVVEQHQCNQQLQQQLQTAALMVKSPLSPAGRGATLPGFLNRLSTIPHMLRSAGQGPSQSKPIPLLDERVDLLQFKRKEPREWCSDDVVAWILDVARRHQIPCENVNLTKFATCSGPLLMLMNEQSFKEHDPNYGALLFAEFCKLVTDENFIDDWMKANAAVAGPSSALQQQPPPPRNEMLVDQKPPPALLQQTAQNLLLSQLAIQQEKQQQQRVAAQMAEAAAAGPSSSSMTAGNNPFLLNAAVAAVQQQQKSSHHQQQQQQQPQRGGMSSGSGCQLPPLNQLLLPPTGMPSSAAAAAGLFLQQQQQNSPQASGLRLQPPAPPPMGPSAITSLSRMLHPIQQQPQGASTSSALLVPPAAAARTLMMAHQRAQQMLKPTTSSMGTPRGVGRPPGSKTKVEKQIRRNKDGRPRKRSQHTKGNKLWEFIRDALKDPRTCPSIVRWEDPAEGVFRIVESERLAFLWGQKKNNQKMTYEKLSRAMRTYYEKEILVPVPKSGLYPKKLVYKFGPTAHGWRTAATLAVQAHLALAGGPSMRM